MTGMHVLTDGAAVIRYAISLTLFVSAAAKFAHFSNSTAGLKGYRVPAALQAPISVFVIVLEAAVATLLILPTSPQLSGGAAVLLSTGFVAVQVYALSNRLDTPCLCFGGVHPDDVVSRRTVARAVLVIAGGVIVFVTPGASAPTWPILMLSAFIVVLFAWAFQYHQVRAILRNVRFARRT